MTSLLKSARRSLGDSSRRTKTPPQRSIFFSRALGAGHELALPLRTAFAAKQARGGTEANGICRAARRPSITRRILCVFVTALLEDISNAGTYLTSPASIAVQEPGAAPRSTAHHEPRRSAADPAA
eukprot:UN11623